MAKQATFEDILNQPMGEDSSWDRPKPIPRGTYLAIVDSYRQDKSPIKETPFIEFTYKIVEPYAPKGKKPDVSDKEIEDMGGVAGRTVRDTYYLADNAKWRLIQFFQNCGIDPVGISPAQACSEVINAELVVSIIQKPSDDGSAMYTNVRSTAKAA